MRKLLIPILLSLAQFTNGQEITKDFTKLLHEENFGPSSSNEWEQAYNTDNLFLVQNGNYQLFRKNKTSGYYLFPKTERVYESMEIKATMSFDKYKNKKQSGGLIIMTQANLTGGIVVELSPKLGYRVQRIGSSGSSSITTGKDGWVKFKGISKTGANTIKIKTYLKIFDLYINDTYVFTFSDIEYFKGGMGLFVGPNSKIRFNKFSIHGEEEIDLANTVIKTKKQEDLSLTQIIVKLRKTLNEKDKEIEELEGKLNNSQKTVYVDTATRSENRALKKENDALKSANSSLESKLNGQTAEIENLRKFKSEIEKTGEGDIVINLTNIVGRQNSEIEKLEKQNAYYKSELETLNERIETNDIELKRVSETNILIRDILIEKDSVIKSQVKEIKKLKRENARLKTGQEVEEEEPVKEEPKEMDKTDLLNQILEKEKREREKRAKKKKEEEESEETEELIEEEQ